MQINSEVIMKKNLLLLFSAVLLFSSCKSTSYQTINTFFLSGNANTISIRTVGIGELTTATQDNAEIHAIMSLLFRGIPDSQQKEPLVSISENEAFDTYNDYFESLLNQKRYKTFIVSTESSSEALQVEKKIYQQTFDITINLKALRSDLERNGIIRKFGL